VIRFLKALLKLALKVMEKKRKFRVISPYKKQEGAWKGPLVILIKVQLKKFKKTGKFRYCDYDLVNIEVYKRVESTFFTLS